MTFAAPGWFWAFAVMPLLVGLLFASERRRVELIGKLVAARLQPRLAGNVSVGKRRVRFLFALLGLAGAIVALARPQWGFTWEEAKRKGRDVIIAIDTSRSMLADDIKPSRLARAKLAAQDLIAELSGDRVGVVAFAGTAFLQAPLTVDYSAALNALKELDTEIIPQGGSNLEGALRSAREAFGKGESENRALVIFSDGEELDADAQKAVDELKGQVRVFSVGIGTPEGALIPMRTRGRLEFVQDDSGNPVRTRLDESRLRAVAEATGGFYLHLETGRTEMQRIARDGLGTMIEQDIDARLSRRPIERYQWPLAAGLVALAVSMLIGERRLLPAARVAALALLLWPGWAKAAWWPKNPGVQHFERGDAYAEQAQREQAQPSDPKWESAKEAYGAAYDEFSKQLKRQPKSPDAHYNFGTAAFKTDKLDEAMAAFSEGLLSDRRDVQVNSRDYLGNTFYRDGVKKQSKEEKLAEWRDAIRQYNEALKLDAENKMVQGHREFVLKKIAELEQEPPKEDEQKKDDQKKDEQKDQEKDKQQDQSQSSKDQQDKGEQKKDEKKDGEGSKDQQPQKPEEKDGQQDKQEPSQDKEGEQKKDGQQPKDQPGEQGKEQPQPGEQGGKPEQMPAQPQEPKKEGELKSSPQAGESQEQRDAAEAAADAQAAAEGRMTPQQARALIESLKGEDAKVRLADPREKQGMRRVLKDW